MKNIFPLILLVVFTARASAMDFDRSAVLPELAHAAKTASSAMGNYRTAARAADKASSVAAGNFNGIPKKERRAAKARALCQWSSSLTGMIDGLETAHASLVQIYSGIEDGVVGGLGEVREKLDGLSGQFSAELAQQQRGSDALLKIYSVAPESISEEDARKLNDALASVAQRKTLLKRLQERRDRIDTINETVQQKVENIKAVISAVEVKIAELKTEKYVVEILKKKDIAELLTEQQFGLEAGGDPAKLFESKSSRSMDIVLNQKNDIGMSQKELLKYRLGRN